MALSCFLKFWVHNLINKNLRHYLLLITGVIATSAAIWHLLCLYGGVSWFIFARAPSMVIQSVQQGTLLAPISTTIIALLMFICGLYAFSCAGMIKKLPLLKTAVLFISMLCLLRVVIVLPILWNSSFSDLWQIIATSVWLFVGVSFLLAFVSLYQQKSQS